MCKIIIIKCVKISKHFYFWNKNIIFYKSENYKFSSEFDISKFINFLVSW